jgi:hypothetical protein
MVRTERSGASHVASRSATPSARESQAGSPSLEQRYRAYCRRQGELLPTLIPREGVRPLYRAAREWALDRGIPPGKDPLAILHQYCEEVLLPLPPFEEWVRHAGGDEAGLAALESQSQGSVPLAEPVLVALRRFAHDSGEWSAGLTVLRRPSGWSGHIAFADGAGGTARSADIFLEDDLSEVRARFESLEPHTLSAFLRSALP